MFVYDDTPTERQMSFAKAISDTLDIACPKFDSKREVGKFISQYRFEFYKERKTKKEYASNENAGFYNGRFIPENLSECIKSVIKIIMGSEFKSSKSDKLVKMAEELNKNKNKNNANWKKVFIKNERVTVNAMCVYCVADSMGMVSLLETNTECFGDTIMDFHRKYMNDELFRNKIEEKIGDKPQAMEEIEYIEIYLLEDLSIVSTRYCEIHINGILMEKKRITVPLDEIGISENDMYEIIDNIINYSALI